MWPPPKVPGPGRVPANGWTWPAGRAAEAAGPRRRARRGARIASGPGMWICNSRNLRSDASRNPNLRGSAATAGLLSRRLGAATNQDTRRAPQRCRAITQGVRLPPQRRPANQPRRRGRGAVENFQFAPLQFGREPQIGRATSASASTASRLVNPGNSKTRSTAPPAKRLVGASSTSPGTPGPTACWPKESPRRRLLPGNPTEDLLPRPPPPLLPPDRQPRPQQRRRHQFHAVTNFQIVPRPAHGPKPYPKGKAPAPKRQPALPVARAPWRGSEQRSS